MAHGSSARHLALVVFVLFGGFLYVGWRIRQGDVEGTPTNATLLITQSTPGEAAVSSVDALNRIDLPSNQDAAHSQADALFADLLAHVPANQPHREPEERLSPMIGGRTPADGLVPVPSGEELVRGDIPVDTLLPPPPPQVTAALPAPRPNREAPAAPHHAPVHLNEVEYVVQRGDTLHAIAHRFLGSPDHAPRLFEHNRGILRTPNEIPAGVRLRIPAPVPGAAPRGNGVHVQVDNGHQYHTVQAGETLSSLAKRYYGSESAADVIRNANAAIRNDRLREGMVLVLPESGRGSEIPSPMQPASYTVQRGDTLSGIARKFYGPDAGWRILYEANRDQMPSPDSLRVGMVLAIPPRP